MELHPISTLFSLLPMLGMAAITISNAASPTAEQYWHSALPNTPLPTALQRLLRPSEASTKPPTSPYVSNSATQCFYVYHYGGHCSGSSAYGVAKTIGEPDTTTNFHLHKDLRSGAKMWPTFYKSTSSPGFSPHSIPFSSQNISEIRTVFSVMPNSSEDKVIREAISACEVPQMDGEEKNCATSLESLVDFVVVKLGKDIDQVISSDSAGEDYKQQEYTVAAAPKLMDRRNFIISHKLPYPYALFYSHRISDSLTYSVSLVGADGSRIETVSVCHMNTSAWAEGHAAFRALKVKPGPAICHFPISETLIWISKIQE